MKYNISDHIISLFSIFYIIVKISFELAGNFVTALETMELISYVGGFHTFINSEN